MRPDTWPKRITDTKLSSEDVPRPRASWSKIQHFALTIAKTKPIPHDALRRRPCLGCMGAGGRFCKPFVNGS